jgi:hypothetical protein
MMLFEKRSVFRADGSCMSLGHSKKQWNTSDNYVSGKDGVVIRRTDLNLEAVLLNVCINYLEYRKENILS